MTVSCLTSLLTNIVRNWMNTGTCMSLFPIIQSPNNNLPHDSRKNFTWPHREPTRFCPICKLAMDSKGSIYPSLQINLLQHELTCQTRTWLQRGRTTSNIVQLDKRMLSPFWRLPLKQSLIHLRWYRHRLIRLRWPLLDPKHRLMCLRQPQLRHHRIHLRGTIPYHDAIFSFFISAKVMWGEVYTVFSLLRLDWGNLKHGSIAGRRASTGENGLVAVVGQSLLFWGVYMYIQCILIDG